MAPQDDRPGTSGAAPLPPSAYAKRPASPDFIDTHQTAAQRLNAHAPLMKKKRPFSVGRFIWTLIKIGFVLGVVVPVVWVAIYRFVPPPGTILMVQGMMAGRGMDYRWTPLSKISPSLVTAAIASEDGKFCEHHGFDFNAIQKAMDNNDEGKKLKGGSTISQQTAKNVFLWPHRDWVRKGAETGFTVLIETIWGKKRIMEMYLNVAEMGPGIYGAQAAAHRYFNTDAAHLSPAQSARLISVLPSPIKYKAAAPGPYVARRAAHVGAAAGEVRRDGYANCVLR
jgi:monofunctional biosynthetic peptidoglycan transglycosylase